MAATDGDRRMLIAALALALVALVMVVGDRLMNADIANRETFDALQLVFAAVALVAGVAVIVRAVRGRADDEPVIDLRERLGDLVDIDDVATDSAMDVHG